MKNGNEVRLREPIRTVESDTPILKKVSQPVGAG